MISAEDATDQVVKAYTNCYIYTATSDAGKLRKQLDIDVRHVANTDGVVLMKEQTAKLEASDKFKSIKDEKNEANAIKILQSEVCHFKVAVDMLTLLVKKGVAFVHEMKEGEHKFSCIFAMVSAVVPLLLIYCFIIYDANFALAF